MKQILLTITISLLAVGLCAFQAAAQDELPNKQPTEVEDALEGFDEPTSDKLQADDDLEGFDDEAEPAVAEAETDKQFLPDWLDIGTVAQKVTVNVAHQAPQPGQTDWRGLSALRTELDLEATVRLPSQWKSVVSGWGFYDFAYVIRGRDNYTPQTLAAYEWEVELRDLYLQGELLPSLDLKLGRQIVVWGKSDSVRVVDVLNPLDRREIGMVDIEDLRLPVTMLKADYYLGDWSLTGIVIPEVRFSKLPAFGHDLYPFGFPLPPEEIPTVSLENLQYAAALSGVFSGWDLSFHYAYIFSDEFYVKQTAPMTVKRIYPRIHMAGVAGNMALGNWLLKTELAWINGLKFATLPDQTFNRLDAMGGFEYTGIHETVVAVEVAARTLLDYDDRLAIGPNSTDRVNLQTTLRVVRDFMNDTVHLSGLASVFGTSLDGGGFFRLNLDYNLADAWTLSGGTVIYWAGDQVPFTAIGDADRVYLKLSYSF